MGPGRPEGNQHSLVGKIRPDKEVIRRSKSETRLGVNHWPLYAYAHACTSACTSMHTCKHSNKRSRRKTAEHEGQGC